MTEKALEAILAELKHLTRGLAEATRQIVRQEGEINALQQIIEQRRLATPQELRAAREDGARALREYLARPEAADPEGPPRRLPLAANPNLCRPRRLHVVRRSIPPTAL